MNESETAISCEVEFQEGGIAACCCALVPFLSEVARTVHIIACCVHLMMNSGPLLTASTLWRLQRSAPDPPPAACVPSRRRSPLCFAMSRWKHRAFSGGMSRPDAPIDFPACCAGARLHSHMKRKSQGVFTRGAVLLPIIQLSRAARSLHVAL